MGALLFTFCVLIGSGVSRQQRHMRSTYVLSLGVLCVQARGIRCTSVVSHTTTTSSIVFSTGTPHPSVIAGANNCQSSPSVLLDNCQVRQVYCFWVRQVYCLTRTQLLLMAASHCCMYSCAPGRERLCRPLYCAPLYLLSCASKSLALQLG